jgi:hypothetical protein
MSIPAGADQAAVAMDAMYPGQPRNEKFTSLVRTHPHLIWIKQ